MRAADLAGRIPSAVQIGDRWKACCPSHEDRRPSLTIKDGERGVLLKCWAGCTLDEICKALAIDVKDLFTDTIDPNPSRRRQAAHARAQRERETAQRAHQMGTLLDALREADYFVHSRRGLDISQWSHRRLNKELNTLADAYHLLDHENLYG